VLHRQTLPVTNDQEFVGIKERDPVVLCPVILNAVMVDLNLGVRPWHILVRQEALINVAL
jgi:hypothetical protein